MARQLLLVKYRCIPLSHYITCSKIQKMLYVYGKVALFALTSKNPCLFWCHTHTLFRSNFSKKKFQKSKYTHVASINLKGKVFDSKNIVTALIYFCNYPYGTPCTNTSTIVYILHSVPSNHHKKMYYYPDWRQGGQPARSYTFSSNIRDHSGNCIQEEKRQQSQKRKNR